MSDYPTRPDTPTGSTFWDVAERLLSGLRCKDAAPGSCSQNPPEFWRKIPANSGSQLPVQVQEWPQGCRSPAQIPAVLAYLHTCILAYWHLGTSTCLHGLLLLSTHKMRKIQEIRLIFNWS
ncbi:hypothetical protein RhiJN_00196 [Ceratobasidium sp. AG-Ba]|nr:hypothetical protein RhiJN_00196 [Ceratobasidium sp. AG-Ba]